MIDFSELFEKSKGKPIQYKGKTLVMGDDFPLPGKVVKLRLCFLQANSEWAQGVSLDTRGTIISGDLRATKGIRIWETLAPRVCELECRSKNGLLDIKNVWDTGDGVVESWTNGAAMWIEELPNGRRYHCNDGHFDDDFDDLVFELLIV